MAKHSFKFDPDAGVAQGVNIVINGGANYRDQYNITDVNSSAFDFTGWTISAQMVKSVAVGATEPASATFVVGFSSAAGGEFISSLAHNVTGNFSEGRYFHNILVSSGSTVYNLAAGSVKVNAGIASAPS
tara:strand:+ start:90 stop:479 length:390 start_codon:yes stop_codon:yes gene_type:complete